MTSKPSWDVSPIIIRALDYVGSHRKTATYPHRTSCPVRMDTAKTLVLMRWAMWNGKQLILTAEGERRWSQRHPYSKYKIS